MSLSGNLRTMSLPDLLQWVAAAGKTGMLTFRAQGITKKILTAEGLIIGSSSTDPVDLIGQWLVSCGRITEDQLRIALGEQERSGTFLGTVLVQMRALTHQDLERMLVLKTEEIIYGLFHWEDAEFEFQDGETDSPPVSISLRVEDVLLKGVRRYDEIQRIRRVFPDGTVVLRRTSLTPPPEVLQNPHARRILDGIDGVRSITAITLHTHASEFIVSKFLFELHQAGYAEIFGAAPASGTGRVIAGAPVITPVGPPVQAGAVPVAPSAVLASARAHIEAGDCDAALTALGAAPPDDPAVRALREEAEAKLSELIYTSVLPPNKVPVLTRPLSEMASENLNAEECYLLSRMDGAWDVQSIVAISPLREVEALRALNGLRERGLIHLQ